MSFMRFAPFFIGSNFCAPQSWLIARRHCSRILPFADRDHQVQFGVARKMVDIRLAIRSVMVHCLQYLLIQSDDHDVWPNVEFIATSHRMRLVWYPEAAVHI